MKGKDYKDYWDVDLGASFIPYDKLDEKVDLDLLEDGGMIDEDTLPDTLKGAIFPSRLYKFSNELIFNSK